MRMQKQRNITTRLPNHSDGLWDITLPQKMPIKLNTLLFKNKQFQDPKLNNIKIKSVINKINQRLNVIIHKNMTKNGTGELLICVLLQSNKKHIHTCDKKRQLHILARIN